ncbi:protein SAAL1 [Pelobates fuscus]|uniref:protein SAAL1 n=1 Tax=Pelobates fuscus TaxID=191477 RepID=UPI002FE4F66B
MEQGKKNSSDASPDPSLDYLDRNPSPPPSDDETPTADSIGTTVFSKHWLFSTLTKLVKFVESDQKTKNEEGEDVPLELDEELEDEVCKLWDMSMNEEVALFLKEFEGPELLVGIIKKSKSKRLTEICMGILANMSCFQETRECMTENDGLGELVLLLLADPDPPTLIETSRFLLTCLSHSDVANTWLERLNEELWVRKNIYFIMSSSTNVDLLVKVGELVEKLFDLDSGMVFEWVEADSEDSVKDDENSEEENPPALQLVPSVLEAAKQLRFQSTEGLDVYLHILQLMTTVNHGFEAIVKPPDCGQSVWEFLYDLTSHELCQPNDPPLLIQEQKTLLSSLFAVMQSMFTCYKDKDYLKIGKNLPLISRVMQVLDHVQVYDDNLFDQNAKKKSDYDATNQALEKDLPFSILKDVCLEFLTQMLFALTKEDIKECFQQGYLNEHICRKALGHVLPMYQSYISDFLTVLSEVDQNLSNVLQKLMPPPRR